MEISLPIFFFMFLLIYLFGYFVVFRNWSRKTRPEAASSLMSLAHGTPALLLALRSMYHAPLETDHQSFGAKNTDSQNTVLEFSLAYFLADLLHYLLFYPNDLPFIFHHLATLYVFATCRFTVSHGAYGILILLVLAEVTSACQNIWSLTGARRADSPAAARVHELLRFPFYGVYSLARGVLAPVLVFEMGVFYAGGAAVPKWVWVSWMVVVACAIVGSLLWVFNLWMELFRERQAKVQEKMQ